MPAPETAIAGAAFVALLTTVTVELKDPVAFGANTMCMVVLCPAAKLAPLTPLVTLYADEPVILTPEMVTVEFPLLVKVTASVVLSPTVSLPKFRLDVEGTSVCVDP